MGFSKSSDDDEVVAVKWDNVLGPDLADQKTTTDQSALVLNGDIITIPSPLCETQLVRELTAASGRLGGLRSWAHGTGLSKG
ncbi:hypothetical protein PspLS_08167 [Pyricularia sp. CBS 133598]|nr:hypothetical protein PspLS_08167 [Pyricularia sp. CBS 133598]